VYCHNLFSMLLEKTTKNNKTIGREVSMKGEEGEEEKEREGRYTSEFELGYRGRSGRAGGSDVEGGGNAGGDT
jgi:hypothetical protein